MKRIWAICSFEIKKTFLKRQSYLIMFGMPLLFTLLFGGLLGSSSPEKINIAFVDEDNTVLSKSLHGSLLNNELFKIKEMDQDVAVKQLKDKKLTGLLHVKKGFEQAMVSGKKPTVLFNYSPDFTSNAMVNQIVSNAISKMAIQTKASTIWNKYSKKSWEEMYSVLDNEIATSPPAIQKISITKNKKTEEMSNMSARSAGFSIMFVMIVMMSVTGVLLDARKTGVWYRLLSTPTTRLQLMAGYFLSFFLIGWIQFGILMASSTLLFGVHWGNPIGIFVLVSSLLLCVVGLGLFISSFVKTTEQQSALGSVVITATCMLAGVYWPLDIVPKFMQKIAEFIPQTWAMKGFTELIARGGSVMDIVAPVCVLLAFSLTFLVIGMTRIRYE
ncbi:ABC transporter permease [Neobacillus sp. PS3-40]|uniref:ABC transporter permease n=1 Tax=Neobacillus sp. PS3-40 TaxID=3070679 RepID=UPI0027DFA8E4|nr:ABC transporter permease [Neobacillus sp. PS3-40]WML42820.1 ABC transporter permease [Neobacillus sp. PS3-40]